ncbi:MAG: nucleotidyltransferase domain-containing protein [Pseudomonadota bacterium]
MNIASLILRKSIARRKILSLFFANEEKDFYVRELEKLTGVWAGNIRRELLHLTNAGLFTTSTRGNLVFYKLNKNCPYYKELSNILAAELGIPAKIKEILMGIKGIQKAFIYGSYINGTFKKDSDIDVMIIGSPPRDQLLHKIAVLEDELRREIDYQVYSQEAFNLNISKGNPFIEEVLNSPKIVLIGEENGYQRKNKAVVKRRKNKKTGYKQ